MLGGDDVVIARGGDEDVGVGEGVFEGEDL